jgi:hypothetical protein
MLHDSFGSALIISLYSCCEFLKVRPSGNLMAEGHVKGGYLSVDVLGSAVYTLLVVFCHTVEYSCGKIDAWEWCGANTVVPVDNVVGNVGICSPLRV